MKTIDNQDLAHVIGGAGGMPLSGDVNQQIITNAWGGTQNIYQPPAPQPMSPYRFEYLKQNPAARWGPPPHKPMPIRR
jgi:bacteriocin-like protein